MVGAVVEANDEVVGERPHPGRPPDAPQEHRHDVFGPLLAARLVGFDGRPQVEVCHHVAGHEDERVAGGALDGSEGGSGWVGGCAWRQ